MGTQDRSDAIESMAYLLVNIDTEEEGLFSERYPTGNWQLGHLRELPGLQAIFDRWGVRPTYMVTSPVALDPDGSACLKRFLDDGRCDIGGHLHPWATEPITDPADAAHSMPCMLSLDSVRNKLVTLTNQIRDRFGMQPVTYRSGRYGSAAEHTPLLVESGYRVETSVCPFVSHAPYGGPDFFGAPIEPYWLGDRDMLAPQSNGQLLSVPISAGFNRRSFRTAGLVYGLLRRRSVSWLRGVGILYRLKLLRFVRLNPEMTSLEDMLMLCRTMIRRGSELFHMTFHSTNIGVGKTPYVPTLDARDAFLERLDRILGFLVNEAGVEPVTARLYYDLVRRRQNVSPRRVASPLVGGEPITSSPTRGDATVPAACGL